MRLVQSLSRFWVQRQVRRVAQQRWDGVTLIPPTAYVPNPALERALRTHMSAFEVGVHVLCMPPNSGKTAATARVLQEMVRDPRSQVTGVVPVQCGAQLPHGQRMPIGADGLRAVVEGRGQNVPLSQSPRCPYWGFLTQCRDLHIPGQLDYTVIMQYHTQLASGRSRGERGPAVQCTPLQDTSCGSVSETSWTWLAPAIPWHTPDLASWRTKYSSPAGHSWLSSPPRTGPRG